jgi:undecaprenyl-diphosphatase
LTHELQVFEAIAAGLLQGVAVVFPISGLGHGVLAGSLGNNAGVDIAPASAGYLYACMHVGVGLALLVYFWRDWVWIGRGLVALVTRSPAHATERRWALLVALAVLPSSIGAAVLAPRADSLLTHPALAAACVGGNGVLMLLVWWWFRRSPRSGGLSGTHRARLSRTDEAEAFAADSSALPAPRMAVVGLLPLASFVPGLSGVGLAMCGALLWRLSQEQAARIALLVLTPFLLSWGGSQFPDLGGSQFAGVRTATLYAAGTALVAGYLATALLMRYFRSASLRPFGYYCVVAGAAALVWQGLT